MAGALRSRAGRGGRPGASRPVTALGRQVRLGTASMVSAEGGWVAKRDHPFSMSYRVIFETATVVYDSASDPMWRAFPADGISEVHLPPLPDRTGYQEEIVHFLDCIESATPSDIVSLSDAAESVRLVEEEIEAIAASARAGSVTPPQ